MARRGSTAAALVVLGLLPGCAGSHSCPELPPLAADVLTVASGDGSVLSSRRVPYAHGPLVLRAGVLTDSASGQAVGRVDPRPAVPTSPVSNAADGYALVRRGPHPWRVPGAAGTYVTTVAGVVVVLGKDSQLRGIRLADGTPVWNARLDHRLTTGQVTAQGGVVFALGSSLPHDPAVDASGRVYAVDARTGRLLWAREAQAARDPRQLAVVAGLLVVGASGYLGETAELTALRPKTGAVVWSASLPRPVVASVHESGGDVLVLDQDYFPGCD
jgi:outer membrane protein assembly factor BamB